MKTLKDSRLGLTEVELKEVEKVASAVIKLSNSKIYDSVERIINDYGFSTKEFYTFLDLMCLNNFNDDPMLAKTIFASRSYFLNDEYSDGFGEPMVQNLLYMVKDSRKLEDKGLEADFVIEVLFDENSKLKFNKRNINLDYPIQVLIDNAYKFTDEQFETLVDLFVNKKGNPTNEKNDFDKSAFDLILYRKKKNKKVFDMLYEKFVEKQLEDANNKIADKLIEFNEIINDNYQNIELKGYERHKYIMEQRHKIYEEMKKFVYV